MLQQLFHVVSLSLAVFAQNTIVFPNESNAQDRMDGEHFDHPLWQELQAFWAFYSQPPLK